MPCHLILTKHPRICQLFTTQTLHQFTKTSTTASSRFLAILPHQLNTLWLALALIVLPPTSNGCVQSQFHAVKITPTLLRTCFHEIQLRISLMALRFLLPIKARRPSFPLPRQTAPEIPSLTIKSGQVPTKKYYPVRIYVMTSSKAVQRRLVSVVRLRVAA